MRLRAGWAVFVMVALAAALVAAFVGTSAASADRIVGSGLSSPEGVAVDSSGDVFIADAGHNRVVEETLSGSSYSETAIISGLDNPTAVAVDGSGNVFVSNTDANDIVEEKPDGSGNFSATTIDSAVSQPAGLAVDSSGDVFVADYGDSQVVEEVLQGDGTYQQSVIGSGVGYPKSVAVDASGDLFITDGNNSRVVEDTPAGGGGYNSPSPVDTSLVDPSGVTVDAYGDVFIADTGDGRVVEDTPNGSGGYTPRTLGSGFSAPEGVAVDSSGDVFVADADNNNVRELTAPVNTSAPTITGTPIVGQLLTRSVGHWTGTSSLTYTYQWQRCDSSGNNCQDVSGATGSSYRLTTADEGGKVALLLTVTNQEGVSGHAWVATAGPVTEYALVDSSLAYPVHLAVDSAGDVFVADSGANQVVKETPNGSGGYSQSVVDSNLLDPGGVAVDASGHVFVADSGDNEVVEETPNGSGGYDQTVVDSNLLNPGGVAVDASGDVFIADSGDGQVVEDTPDNDAYDRAAVVDSLLVYPNDVAVDGSGDVFVADTFSGRVVEDTPNGSGYTQTTVDSSLSYPEGVAVDGFGNVFIADSGNNRILEERPTGGGRYRETELDPGQFNNPDGVALDGSGHVFVADANDNRVVELQEPTTSSPPSISGTAQDGQTLTRTSIGHWTGIDGLTYSYQWQRCDSSGNNCQSIAGATSSSYKLTHYDVGHKVALAVIATDQQGVSGEAIAASLGPVANPPAPVGSGTPTVSSVQYVLGQALKPVTYGTWTSADPLTYSYQWQRCDNSGANCTNIDGATHSNYKLVHADIGNQVRVLVNATDAEGQLGTALPSAPVGPVIANPIVGSGFVGPTGVAVDSAGDVFVADTGDGQVVEEIPNPDGSYTPNPTPVGSGLDAPHGVAVDASGDVFVTSNDGGGELSEYTSNYDGTYSQTVIDPSLSFPEGVAVDGSGDVFVAEPQVNTVVEEAWNGSGYAPSTFNSDPGSAPEGVAVDGSGDVFISQLGDGRVVEDPAGGGSDSLVASGLGPFGVAVDGSGDVFVASSGSVLEEAPNGSGGYTQTTVGSGFSGPREVAVDSLGDVFVADSGDNQVVELQAPHNTSAPTISGPTTITRTLTASVGRWTGIDSLTYSYQWQRCDGSGDNCQDVAGATRSTYPLTGADLGDEIGLVVTATDQEGLFWRAAATPAGPVTSYQVVDSNLSDPEGVAVDGSGDVFVANTFGSDVVKDTPNGSGGYTQTTVDSTLSYPEGVAVDGSGDVFVADTDTSRLLEETPNDSGGYDQSVVDSGLSFPEGVAVDSSGDVFVADAGNNRVVEDTYGSGGWTQSTVDYSLSGPAAVAVDGSGDVFVADSGDNRVVEDTLGGSGWTQSTVASVNFPLGVAVDQWGDVFAADTADDEIVEEAPAGPGAYTQAILNTAVSGPEGLALDSSGDLFVADANNNRVVELPAPANTSAPSISSSAQDGQTLRATSRGSWKGYGPFTYSYQWQRCDSSGGSCQNIAGATGSNYKLTHLDVGQKVRLVVAATTPDGVPGHAATAPGGVVADPPAPSNTSRPTFSGTLQVGQTLTSTRGSWTSADPLIYSYQWQRCDSSGSNCRNIAGATRATYLLTGADAGHQVTLAVTATDAEAQQTTATAALPGIAVTADVIVASNISSPQGVAVDSAGDVFVAGQGNDVLYKETPNVSGGYTQSVVDDSSSFGTAYLSGTAVDSSGNVFTADAFAGRLFEDATNGSGGYTESTLATDLSFPNAVAVDSAGDVFVADTFHHRIVEEASEGGGVYTESTVLGGLAAPEGVAVDSAGDLFVSLGGSDTVVKETPNTVGGGYTQSLVDSNLSSPIGLAVDGSGDVFVADSGDHQVVEEAPNDSGGYTARVLEAGLSDPTGVAVDSVGNAFISDSGTGRILEFQALANTALPAVSGTLDVGAVLRATHGLWSGLETLGYSYQWQRCDNTGNNCVNIAHATGSSYRLTTADVADYVTVVVTASDGATRTAQATAIPIGPVTDDTIVDSSLDGPRGIALDAGGDIFVADPGNNRVVEETRNGSGGYTQTVVDSDLNYPEAVALDNAGDVFIADTDNSRVVEDTPQTGGGYSQSTVDSNLLFPDGIAVDQTTGALYIADSGTGELIKDTSNGGGYTQNVIDSTLDHPAGVAVDSSGDVFVGSGNGDTLTEEVYGGGNDYTPTPVGSGFSDPGAVTVDGSGDVFVADTFGHRVVEETPDGGGYSQRVVDTHLDLPEGVAVDGVGNLFVADSGDNRVVEFPTLTSMAAPTISGSPIVGQTLRASPGSWAGLEALTYSYQWYRCSTPAPACAIDGATGSAYRLTDAEIGDQITVVVAASDGATRMASATSSPVGPVTSYVVVDSALSGPNGVAVDGSGDVFVADANQVVEDTPSHGGGYTQSLVHFDPFGPFDAVAVDGSGDVFDTSEFSFIISGTVLAELEPAPGSGWQYADTINEFLGELLDTGVAVDAAGNVFSEDDSGNIVEYQPDGSGGYDPPVTIVHDASAVQLAVDAAGDVFTEDGDQVVKFAPNGSGGYTESTVDVLVAPTGVAVDRFGDVFVSDSAENMVVEETPNGLGGYAHTVLQGDFDSPSGLAVDRAGDVFVADKGNNRVVELPAPANTSPPTITGTVQDGQTLYASYGHWTGIDSLTYSYRWQRCDSSGAGCQNIAGATRSSYKLTSVDVGHKIVLVATATDQEGVSGNASAAVGPVPTPAAPSNTSLPMITGTPSTGQVLSLVSRGTWTSPEPLTYAYHWQRCNSSGGSCQGISGAIGSSYKVTRADVDHEITLQVTATDLESQSTAADATPLGSVPSYLIVDSSLSAPQGIAVDSSGDLFISEAGSNKVVEDKPNGSGGYSQVVVDTDLDLPARLALDSAGNLFIADSGHHRVVEDTPNGSGVYSRAAVVDSDLTYPVGGVAVDGSGDVFITETSDNEVVEETPGGGGYTPTVIDDNVTSPAGVAVDSSGDVFVAEQGQNVVVEEKPGAGGSYTQTTISTGSVLAYGVTVDSLGDLFIADAFHGSVAEERPDGSGGYSATVLENDLSGPMSTAVDAAGDVFIADSYNNRVGELPAPVNTSAPSISGTRQVGQTLTRSVGHWTGIDSLTYSYQWQRCTSSGANCQPIAGATGSAYKLTSADISHEISLVVTATDQEGVSGHASATPVGPVPTPTVTAISAGAQHTCALISTGAIKCWGRNDDGELGHGTTSDSSTPVTVAGITTATSVSAGGSDTCAVLSGGSVECWGSNYYGQLGNGTRNPSVTPVVVSGISTATAVSMGYDHACALLADGTVECWGDNYYGQLGDPDYGPPNDPEWSTTPLPVVGIGTATSVTTGDLYSCASLADGTVDCWGYGAALGNAGVSSNDNPTPVAVTGITTAAAVDAGYLHTCAELSGGGVECWGSTDLGDTWSQPAGVSGITTASAVSAGGDHSCAVLTTGAIDCWGFGEDGELGDGQWADTETPVTVTGITTATAVSAGGNHSCALLAAGTVECWGLGTYGELGTGAPVTGATIESSTPVTVVGLP